MRYYLKQGDELKLVNRVYVIDEMIGEGANCIVYDAHSYEDNRHVRIKELYPIHAEINRSGSVLEWKSDYKRELEENKFREVCQKNIEIQNNPIFGNVTSQIIDSLAEANNTLYMVVAVDNGVTFDKDSTKDLGKILRTVLALSKIIYEYHKQGLVHLDIKPQNFLVVPETRDIVKLIDIDSICSLKSVNNGEIECLSYSKGWAAPELVQKKVSAIGYHTDIYSIGVILFERLFKRLPNDIDRGIFKKWNVEEVLDKIYAPSVCVRLNSLIERCLNTTIKKRYQEMEELIQDIEAIYEQCSRKEYIKSSYALLSNQSVFVGRKNEINKIRETLDNHQAVVLHGFSGIGKTTVAYKYIEQFKEEYDTVVFFRYKGSLEDFIMSIAIETVGTDSDKEIQETFGRKIRRIRQLANSRTLFVIDNFDTNTDSLLEDILSIDAKFLFTSRVSDQGIESTDIVYMNLEKLSSDECIELFERESGILLNSEKRQYVLPIIEKYENHSYAISLLAKYVSKSGRTVKEICTDLLDEGITNFGEDTDCILHRKDGKYEKNNVLGHIRELFKIMNLSDEYIKVFENIYYLSKIGAVRRDVYKIMTSARNFNTLDDMVERGLVKEIEEREYLLPFPGDDGEYEIIYYYSLHPLIDELYRSLQRDKRKSDVYITCRSYFERKENWDDPDYEGFMPMSIGEKYYEKFTRAFFGFIDKDSFNSRDIELLVRIALHQYENRTRKPLKTIFFIVRKYYNSNIQSSVLNYMVDFCLDKNELKIGDSDLSWCYPITVITVMYYKYLHTKKEHMLRVIDGLLTANESFITIIEQADKEHLINVRYKAIIDLVMYELTILNTDILYTGYTIYNSQRNILNECGFKHLENGGVWISIRKCVKGEAVYFFRRLLVLCRLICEKFEAIFDIEEIEQLGKSIIWNLQYLNGHFVDPFDIDFTMNIPEEDLLYFSNKKDWAEQLSASLINVVRTTDYRVWIYKLVLDDIFLLEQPKKVVQNLGNISIFDMILQDEKISEADRISLLNEVAVTNCVKFLTLGKRKYKAKRLFEERYDYVIQYYGQNNMYWRNQVKRNNNIVNDNKNNILCSLILISSINDSLEELKEILSIYLADNTERNLQEIVLVVKKIRHYGYKDAYKFVTNFLIDICTIDEDARNWEKQVCIAVALSEIAPYQGKNNQRKKYVNYVESKVTLEMCYDLIQKKILISNFVERMINIVLSKINNELSEYLYTRKESTVLFNNELQGKIELLEKIMNKYREMINIERIAIIPEEIYMMSRFLYKYNRGKLMDEGNEEKSVLFWYKKRKRYDEEHNFVGEKYLNYICEICSWYYADYVLRVCESQKLLNRRKEIFDSVYANIPRRRDSIDGDVLMNIPNGIDEDLPF